MVNPAVWLDPEIVFHQQLAGKWGWGITPLFDWHTNPQKWEEMLILTRYNNHLSARPQMQYFPKGWLSTMADSTTKTCHPSEPHMWNQGGSYSFSGRRGLRHMYHEGHGGSHSVTDLPPEALSHPGPSPSLDTGIRYPGRPGGFPQVPELLEGHSWSELTTIPSEYVWQPL